MYKFVKPSESPSAVTGGLKTTFNGKVLDDVLSDANGYFKTLSVDGRGVIQRRIQTTEIPYRDGLYERGASKYTARIITVKYMLKARTSLQFRVKMNELNKLLVGDKLRLIFSDEVMYYHATLQSSGEQSEETNTYVGELIFLCSDPYKYYGDKTLPVDTGSIHNNGTAMAPPIFTVNFTKSAAEFVITHQQSGKFVRVIYNFIAGDILVIDLAKRKVTISGMLKMTAYDWRSQPFNLPQGASKFTTTPGVATTTISFKERWL